jgi:signal transduction histidine kinase
MLANAAAHEINNPLTIVLGRLELLVPHADPETRRRLEAMLAAANRIRTIVERMTRITRLETLDLASYLRPTLDIVRSSEEDQPGADSQWSA